MGFSISPALCGSKIFFTNIGFNHLIRKNRELRSSKEQWKRFALLKYAKCILEDQKADIMYRQRASGMAYIHFWAFAAIMENHHIKIVVSQIDDGEKQFLSIMESRNKQKDPR